MLVLLFGIVFVLSGCTSGSMSMEPITAESEGIWDGLILYNLSRVIIWISELMGGNYGLGIIIFTLLIRVLLIPVTRYQMKSTQKMSDLAPQMQELKEKYNTEDKKQVEEYNEAVAQLYEENDANPYASCLPLLVQTPILIALYQTISRTPIISSSDFLWVNLGQPDPYYILPLLAALLAFANSKLTMMNSPSQPGTGAMVYAMPLMIFFISFRLASALSLYFVVSNAAMVAQTLLLNNPFKRRKEMEAKEAAEYEAEERRLRALKRARKTGRSVKK
ncbi:MAG: membrane protein insertase YidC [Atopococcus tabaci]|uniref:Membrane protein insertase YidC n=1 Tax=Atopococcus tabaci TaxID=269774 RepID=A0AA43ZS57_9LACT|nr:membrane protein insertase YidC [Atopococcus tabaci]